MRHLTISWKVSTHLNLKVVTFLRNWDRLNNRLGNESGIKMKQLEEHVRNN